MQAWWEAWYEADYSWDGLNKHPWSGWHVAGDSIGQGRSVPKGARQATLQDYWRWVLSADGLLLNDDEMVEHLIVVEGQKTYHKVHLPYAYQDQTPTAKAQWRDDVLEIYLKGALDASINNHSISQLAGGVYTGFDINNYRTGKSVRLSFSNSTFIKHVILCRNINWSDFKGCLFFAKIIIDNCNFIGLANFS